MTYMHVKSLKEHVHIISNFSLHSQTTLMSNYSRKIVGNNGTNKQEVTLV